jgi:5'-methylthioadenosine phosphorylase
VSPALSCAVQQLKEGLISQSPHESWPKNFDGQLVLPPTRHTNDVQHHPWWCWARKVHRRRGAPGRPQAPRSDRLTRMRSIGLIAGSGFEALFPFERPVERMLTRHGRFDYYIHDLGGTDLVVVPRHGTDHSIPPHRIPTMAQLAGLVRIGVEKVVAMSAVGAANESYDLGDIVLPDQFIDLTTSRRSTFYDRAAVHTDMSVPFCPRLRGVLASALGRGATVHAEGTYTCTEGPRYETPAEVRMIKILGGHLIGSSAGPEITLARELGLCYALVAMVSNHAAGYQHRVVSRDILDVVWSHGPRLARPLADALREAAAIPTEPPCTDNAFEASELRDRLVRRI